MVPGSNLPRVKPPGMSCALSTPFCCRENEEDANSSQNQPHFRRRLDAMGITYKSLHVVNDDTICLNLSGTRITDLSPLTELPVTHLCLQGCYGITNFSPLWKMRLSWLNLCRTRMTELSVLSRMPLSHLDLRGTRAADLLPLTGVGLACLDIRFTVIRDVSPLGQTPCRLQAPAS
jgi:hypothetical protein